MSVSHRSYMSSVYKIFTLLRTMPKEVNSSNSTLFSPLYHQQPWCILPSKKVELFLLKGSIIEYYVTIFERSVNSLSLGP